MIPAASSRNANRHQPQRPRLSLCMIVRDNQDTLPACLESIRSWVDEIIVVDTGSLDRTPTIASEFGARVYSFPWCDDFSAARNESLKYASGQWLFWMDSDDTIDAVSGRKLRELAYGSHDPATLGYVMQVHCPGPDDNGTADATVVDHVKMFRNHPELRFEFRIHEQMIPAIRRLGGQIGWTDVFVVHSGADYSDKGKQKKNVRDLRILELELKERGDHPFALFNLGMTYADMGEQETAVGYLRRCLEVSEVQESHVRKAYALLVSSLAQLSRTDEAWSFCQEGRSHYPDDAELLFREGMLAHERGEFQRAAQSYRGALDNGEERHFSSLNRGITGHKARHNLALVYQDMGRWDLAELTWWQVVGEVPGYRAGRKGLIDALLRQGRLAAAEVEIEKIRNCPPLRCDEVVLSAELAERRSELPAARGLLEQACREFPNETGPLEASCKFFFEHGELPEAEQALRELLDRQPDNASALHNLGVVYLRLGDHVSAADSLRQSVNLRPRSAITWEQFAVALDALGQSDDADSARKEARRVEDSTTDESL